MKTIILLSLFVFASAQADTQTFGEAFEQSSQLDFNELIVQAPEYVKKSVTVTAKVDKVCQSKGCWFEVKNNQGEATKVVFKDYSFFVPKDIAGKTVLMQGKLKSKEMSVREQRHYLKDAGASKAEIKAVKKPKQVYQFEASGLKII